MTYVSSALQGAYDMFYRYEVLEKDGKVEFSQEEMEDSEEDYEEDEDAHYCPSSTAGDYGPGNSWDAPGMSIKDFI